MANAHILAPAAHAVFVSMLLSGGVMGWLIWSCAGEKTSYDPATKLLARSGSPVTLVLVLAAFCSKFGLSVYLVLYPDISSNAFFPVLYAGVSGLIDGLFLGGPLRQVWIIRKDITIL